MPISEELQAITWTGSAVRLIDQTALPGALTYLSHDPARTRGRRDHRRGPDRRQRRHRKIGFLGVALACADAGIPFVVAAPWSTVDLTAKSEAEISIEQRAGEEVLSFGVVRTSSDDTEAFNPAFDITPARLITALATETGILEVSSGQPPVRGISAAEKPASRSWETGS